MEKNRGFEVTKWANERGLTVSIPLRVFLKKELTISLTNEDVRILMRLLTTPAKPVPLDSDTLGFG